MRPNDDELENINEIEEEDDENVPAIVREDKIFNNRYNTGDGLPDSDEYSLSRGISVSRDYSDSYLRDLYEYESELETKFILDAIFSFLQNDPEISEIITRSSTDPFVTKSKFSKEDVNFIFNKINTTLELKSNVIMFYSPIYILEVISSISSIEYKKLFDMLETEIQELLLTELNKKYQFLDGKMHKKKIH
jgi:hypothetical protein